MVISSLRMSTPSSASSSLCKSTPSQQSVLFVITLDGKVVEIEGPIIPMSSVLLEALQTARHCIVSQPHLLPEVDADSLEDALRWCRHHLDDPDTAAYEENHTPCMSDGGKPWKIRHRKGHTYIPKWDLDFLTQMNQDTLCALVNTAYRLKMKQLMDYSCAVVARRLASKSVEEIRAEFCIKNDLMYSEDEENGDEDDVELLYVDHSRTSNYKWSWQDFLREKGVICLYICIVCK